MITVKCVDYNTVSRCMNHHKEILHQNKMALESREERIKMQNSKVADQSTELRMEIEQLVMEKSRLVNADSDNSRLKSINAKLCVLVLKHPVLFFETCRGSLERFTLAVLITLAEYFDLGFLRNTVTKAKDCLFDKVTETFISDHKLRKLIEADENWQRELYILRMSVESQVINNPHSQINQINVESQSEAKNFFNESSEKERIELEVSNKTLDDIREILQGINGGLTSPGIS